MRRRTLAESLESLQELDFMAGPGMAAGDGSVTRPDASGLRGRGSRVNFDPLDDKGPEWPYEDDDSMNYGVPSGPRGLDRGTRPGTDVHGGPPTPRYANTWEGGPTNESDADEADRHGRGRNVWRDTPDGEAWTEMNNEAMGVPSNSAMAYRGGNMAGATVPGTSGGWARSPNLGDEEDDMRLREFFDPAPVPVDEIDNPEQDNFGDQTDDDLENKVDRIYGGESNDDFAEPPEGDDDVPSASVFMIGSPGSGQFKSSPDMLGAARGTYGLHSDGKGTSDLVDKGSAWDVLKKVVDAMSPEEECEVGSELGEES